jgi:hypothetical protein
MSWRSLAAICTRVAANFIRIVAASLFHYLAKPWTRPAFQAVFFYFKGIEIHCVWSDSVLWNGFFKSVKGFERFATIATRFFTYEEIMLSPFYFIVPCLLFCYNSLKYETANHQRRMPRSLFEAFCGKCSSFTHSSLKTISQMVTGEKDNWMPLNWA